MKKFYFVEVLGVPLAYIIKIDDGKCKTYNTFTKKWSGCRNTLIKEMEKNKGFKVVECENLDNALEMFNVPFKNMSYKPIPPNNKMRFLKCTTLN